MRRLALRVPHLVIVLCLGVTTLVVAQNEPASPQSPQVFRGTVDFVSVDAYPRRNGQLVEGLQAADFEVFEDGKLQKIDTFELVRSQVGAERSDPRNADEAARWVGDPKRRVFIVYVDLYHITRSAAHFMRAPMMEFLSHTIGPSEVVVVMTPETPVSGIVFAGTLNTLAAEVERYWEWGLDEPPLAPRTPAEFQLAGCGNAGDGFQTLLRLHRNLVLFTSLESLMTRLGSMREERTSIILLSEGWTNGTGGMMIPVGGPGGRGASRDVQFGPFGAQTSDVVPVRQAGCDELLGKLFSVDFQDRFKQLLQRANAANVAFYPIDVGGLRTYAANASTRMNVPSGDSRRTTVLKELAENTDGMATADSNDLPRAFQRITDSLAGYYLLGYYTTNSKHDGKFRKIEVNVRQKDVRVTARRGYTAPVDALPGGLEPRMTSAPIAVPVADAIGRLSRLSPDAGMFGNGVASSAGLDIVAELTSRQIEGGRWRDGADVRVELTGADGAKRLVTGHIDAGRRSVALHVPAAVADRGPWQAFIAIIGGGDELAERVAITAPATTLLGDPRIYRGPPNVRLPLQPAAALLFQRGERARVEWPLHRPADQRTVRVLDRRGQLLARDVTLAELTSDAGTVIAADVNLANLAEGDYLLEVTVGAGAETDRRLLGFRIAR